MQCERDEKYTRAGEGMGVVLLLLPSSRSEGWVLPTLKGCGCGLGPAQDGVGARDCPEGEVSLY